MRTDGRRRAAGARHVAWKASRSGRPVDLQEEQEVTPGHRVRQLRGRGRGDGYGDVAERHGAAASESGRWCVQQRVQRLGLKRASGRQAHAEELTAAVHQGVEACDAREQADGLGRVDLGNDSRLLLSAR